QFENHHLTLLLHERTTPANTVMRRMATLENPPLIDVCEVAQNNFYTTTQHNKIYSYEHVC
ncbi:hypothetical protein DOY81_001735, partial [Sarcophaga bullata]